jgi:hypothetical protein
MTIELCNELLRHYTRSSDQNNQWLCGPRKSKMQDFLSRMLNLVLREGIKSMIGLARKRKSFQTRSVDLGSCRTANVDNVAEVLAIADGESFR